MKCRTCGFTKEKGQLDKKKHLHEISRNTRTMLVIEGESENGKPTIKAHCSECGNDKAYWWLRQLRSADESEVTVLSMYEVRQDVARIRLVARDNAYGSLTQKRPRNTAGHRRPREPIGYNTETSFGMQGRLKFCKWISKSYW